MKREGPYSNVVSIIQSSGTGKSCMVDQLVRSVFTIPFNIRSANDDHGISLSCSYCINLKFFYCLDLAFPPPDDMVRTHLVSKALAAGTAAEDIERFYLCFLASLFSKTKDELERAHTKHQQGTKSLVVWWRDYLRQPDVHLQLYSTVVNEAEGFTAKTVSLMSCTPHMFVKLR
jgi:hypothetical protein